MAPVPNSHRSRDRALRGLTAGKSVTHTTLVTPWSTQTTPPHALTHMYTSVKPQGPDVGRLTAVPVSAFWLMEFLRFWGCPGVLGSKTDPSRERLHSLGGWKQLTVGGDSRLGCQGGRRQSRASRVFSWLPRVTGSLLCGQDWIWSPPARRQDAWWCMLSSQDAENREDKGPSDLRAGQVDTDGNRPEGWDRLLRENDLPRHHLPRHGSSGFLLPSPYPAGASCHSTRSTNAGLGAGRAHQDWKGQGTETKGTCRPGNPTAEKLTCRQSSGPPGPQASLGNGATDTAWFRAGL